MENIIKQVEIKRIDSQSANAFVRRWHYSGKVCANSHLHFGAFLNKRLHGVLSFGSSLDKGKVQGIVAGTGWNEFCELNRMAFDDYMPKNSESRSLSVCLRLIKKHCPHIKWVISYADGTQSGHGTIYQATGFVLTQIRENKTIWEAPDGKVATDLSLRLASKGGSDGSSSMKSFKAAGYKPKAGYQFRYIYFIDKASRANLKCDEIPFSRIKELGIGMYKGLRTCCNESMTDDQSVGGGAIPTSPLQYQGGIVEQKDAMLLKPCVQTL